ncbi:sugar transferase [Arabiibacter massiliensis]|uniref:sugar transferase n=1 Tax=Arabiibacter massiliensis TaxID=1870985 RepID=UPI0009BB62B2|nr:sugar transferase [Arabiibacter massiliensis]
MAARLHPGVSVRLPLSRIPSKSYAHAKRVFDIACAALAIVALSPALLACAVAVKATSPGPVLFRQERWGRAGGRFECWKFRTMLVETPPDMPAQDFEDKDAFMTPVGDFLRRWSLDELPQLANILKGDMSVVGPRPVIIRERRLIDLRIPLNAEAVRPGLTGWAQVNGRNLVTDEEKAFLDGEYVANMSLAFDARVFFKTLSVVVSRRGVDRDARAEAGK